MFQPTRKIAVGGAGSAADEPASAAVGGVSTVSAAVTAACSHAEGWEELNEGALSAGAFQWALT